MQLIVLPQVGARSPKVRLEKQDTAGSTLAVFVLPLAPDQKDYRAASRALGVPEQRLLTFFENDYRKRNISVLDLTPPPPSTAYLVRGEQGRDGTTYRDFAEALKIANSRPDTVIEWQGTEVTCCLDLDFHGKQAPEPHDLLSFCETLRPTPAHWWLSRSGGLHAIFHCAGAFSADEIAAVAGHLLSVRFPTCRVELLHRTRRAPGDVFTRGVDADINSIRSLLNQRLQGDYSEYLESKGLVGSDRFPHTLCPINPSVRAEGNSNPVVLHSDHVHCFICAADGITRGSSTPGHFPLSVLAGERVNTAIAECVKFFVHWGHAQFVLKGPVREELAERVYSALLKLQHGSDPRIPLVFTAAKDFGLVRYDGYWCDYNGSILALGKDSHILRSLPYCQRVNSAGELEEHSEGAEWLSQTIDLSTGGYAPLRPIRGIQMTQFQELPPNKVYTVLQTPDLAPPQMVDRRPKYVADTKRMPLEKCKEELDRVFPKVDFALLELLLVGRGCVEHRSGLPPMLFLTGPTGAGKTGHALVAAGIAGDSLGVIPFAKDLERLRQNLIASKQSGGFVLFDEIFKNARIAKMSDVDAMETLLTFTPNSTSHVLYVGPVRLGDLPFCIWADSGIPYSVQSHEQVGRRMFHYHLNGAVSWEKPLHESGIREPHLLRALGKPELVAACDGFLSHVIDRWFNGAATDFAEVAGQLGFKRLRECGAVQDKYAQIRELFDIVCSAPDADGVFQKKYGKGSKEAKPDGLCPIFTALDDCWDDEEKRKPTCRMLLEADLKQVLGLKDHAKFEIRQASKGRFAVRFVSKNGDLINGELR